MSNLLNRTFGRLYVKEEGPKRKNSIRTWVCACDCGNRTIVQGGNLLNGHTTSCGCRQQEVRISVNTKHGQYKHGKPSKTMNAYKNMIRRCFDPKNRAFKHYGGRGIKVCDRWRNSFQCFLFDMGECPPSLTLERINTDGNYEPTNCKWATWKEQQNNRRNNVSRRAEMGLR